MALDNWVDKQDGIDDILAEDINSIANAVIETQEEINKIVIDQTYSSGSENAQSGKAVAEAVATEQKRADNTFANALKGSKSGSAILIDDISPVTHEMGVKISSDTVTDLTAVKVSRYGKNLFDIDTVLPSFINNYGDVGKWIKQSDGSYYKGNVGTGYGDIWFENKANYKGQIAISMASKHTITDVGESGLTLNVAYTDGTQETAIHTPMLSETYSVRTFVTNANKTVFRITQSYNNGEGMYVKDVMIAYGSDTSYEPYIKPTTYQSTADGIVEGVLSLYPNTTLMTDTEGVIIDCEHNRDINKAFAALEAAIATNNS